jgi:16S rRNA A1518/A1519 N6-dimethyltransferase RsmA/KsgA/DIM1 with predicted DNA glycosylase/AP lyase activity
MKGGNMENTHSTFLVLKIQEDKDNGRADIKVVESFTNMVDAKRYKEAKDSIERLSPEYKWMITQYKIQQIFYKSFVLDKDDRKIV